MNYGNNIGYLGTNPGSLPAGIEPQVPEIIVNIGDDTTNNSSHGNRLIKHTQVYYATHSYSGERDLYMNRSFISFSFGGKLIEDFNLISITDGDRLNKQLHANFQDLTVDYEVLDGQFYWGTYYSDNQITFKLATDGMTQNQLDDFKNWFSPGNARELILSEHPNRAIMARIAEPATMDILPFGEEVNFMINNTEYKTKTTLYKGEIDLKFIMDEPFWYSKVNLLTNIKTLENFITLLNKNRKIIKQFFKMPDGMSFIYQDNNSSSPQITNSQENAITEENYADIWTDANDNVVYVFEDKDALKIILEDRIPTLSMLRDPIFLGNNLIFRYDGEDISTNSDSSRYIRKIGENITLQKGTNAYLYYSGTAPEKPIISFKGKKNIFSDLNDIIVTSTFDQYLTLKKPRIYKDFDIAYSLIQNFINNNNTLEEIKDLGRTQLTHIDVKQWFFYILNYYEKHITGFSISNLLDAMVFFLDETNLIADFSFNFQTGIMRGSIPHRKIIRDITNYNQLVDSTYVQSIATYEDVSDMVVSPPIILSERNHPDENGIIKYWTADDPLLSYKITHTFNGDLQNLSFEYKNKYY